MIVLFLALLSALSVSKLHKRTHSVRKPWNNYPKYKKGDRRHYMKFVRYPNSARNPDGIFPGPIYDSHSMHGRPLTKYFTHDYQTAKNSKPNRTISLKNPDGSFSGPTNPYH